MANMSYCRFHNTVGDMEECIDHLDDQDLSEPESQERERFLDLCRQVAEDYPE